MQINITENFERLMLVAHPQDQAMLQPTNIHGKDFVFASTTIGEDNEQRNKTEFRQLTYEVKPTLNEVLPTDELPCHKSGVEYDIKECLEKYVEDQDGCILPWRVKQGSDDVTICENATSYLDMQALVLQQ